MTLKKLLGLEAFPLTDEEIMRKIEDAQQRHLSVVEFSIPTKRVKIKVTDVEPQGVMREYWDYYAK